MMRIQSTGTVTNWVIKSGTTGTTVTGTNSAGTQVFSTGIATGLDLFGQWNLVRFVVTQTNSNTVTWRIDWKDIANDGSGDTGGNGGTFTGTIGRPTNVASPSGGFASDVSGMALGHISAWFKGTNAEDVDNGTTAYLNGITAWAGETAGARLLRLAEEEGVPVSVVGSVPDTTQVGAQGQAPLLDLLRECADADGGFLCESPDLRTLVYRTRKNLYSQEPALVLDYAAGHIASPFEPVNDDSVRNHWDITRKNGSTGSAQLDTGPLGTAPPPTGIGLVPDTKTLNLEFDSDAQPRAYWELNQSTVNEPRYASVTVLLHKFPELIPAVQALARATRSASSTCHPSSPARAR